MIRLFSRFTSNKIVRYIISGGTAALVSLGFLYLLTESFGLWYLLSSTIAFIFAFCVSFVLQKLWTFGDKRRDTLKRQLAFYFATALVGLAFNSFSMYALVDFFGFWYMAAQVLTSGMVAFGTFFIYGNFIFNRDEEGPDLKRRILVATGLYPPEIGGPATYARFLEEELPRRDFSVSTLPFGAVRSFPRLFRHGIYFLKTLSRGASVSIIYALDPFSVGFPALLAAKILRKRFILRVAGDYAWEQLQTKNTKFVTVEEFQKKKFDFLTEMRRKTEHFVAKHAETIVVPSNYLKGIVGEWGVPSEKIKVIYNSFEGPRTKITKEEARKKNGVSGTVIFSAGRLVSWKGFPVLIDAAVALQKEIPDIKLYIAGDGPDREALNLYIARSKVQERVFLLGRLSQGELLERLSTADMFVLNTGYEGFSHQLLEVMACGVPVITTFVGGNGELIEDQKTGILVTYNDKESIARAVRKLFHDRNFSDVLAKNGIKKSESFSRERAISALLEIL